MKESDDDDYAQMQQQHYRSAERLPTLSPFDEERIVWRKNMEDDIENEEARRRRRENEWAVRAKQPGPPPTTPAPPSPAPALDNHRQDSLVSTAAAPPPPPSLFQVHAASDDQSLTAPNMQPWASPK